MVTIKVKSLWKGQVGIPDRYIDEALDTGQGVLIEYKDEYMEITGDKLAESIRGKSDRKFQDRYGKNPDYYLYYIIWKPTIKQNKLL